MLYNQMQGSLWSELARRLFGGARVHTVAPELGIQVDLFSRPELWALHSGSLQIGLTEGLAAGGAGFRSQIAISMIAATRSIFILERILLGTTTAEWLQLGWSATDLTTSTGNLVMRDSRRAVTTGGSTPGTARIRLQNNAALANVATNLGQIRSNGWTDVELNIVIGPGWSVRIFPTADNTAINSAITIIGRERTCTPDELAVL